MLAVGDINVFVHDFKAALKFWCEGFGLEIADQPADADSEYALLEFPGDGPAIHLLGGAEPWPEGQRPALGTRPTIRFDIVTLRFDDVLVRVLENGGRQMGEIETYEDLRSVTIADPDGNTIDLIEVPEHDED